MLFIVEYFRVFKMKKIPVAIVALLTSGSMAAQNIYQMEQVSSNDLTGTARYVGMGGAMSALGADISVMGTNPAGIALFRRSDIAASLSVVSQQKGEKFDGKSPTHVSFDNIGFVFASQYNTDAVVRFFNFGFNYNKRKNMNQLLSAGMEDPAGGMSQLWQLADMNYDWGGVDKSTPLARGAYRLGLIREDGVDEQGYKKYVSDYYSNANIYKSATWGGIQQYDFNFSTNLLDRFYLGMTIGFYNVDYKSYAIYDESLDDGDKMVEPSYLTNETAISGNGFDVKFGGIVRPFEDSPFRIGFSVATPIFYSLKTRSYATLSWDGYDYGMDNSYKYNIRSPWRFGLSLGHTIGNFLALGAEYEYADYGSTKVSYDSYYDDGWEAWTEETNDRALNNEAKRYLKGVSSFKIGAEARVADGFYLRAGYNYVQSPIEKDAYYNQYINSASLDYSTSTAYMNLSDINRFTCGIGMRGKHLYADFAYQYQKQSGQFYAFTSQWPYDNLPNELPATKINLDKHQVVFTLGYKF